MALKFNRNCKYCGRQIENFGYCMAHNRTCPEKPIQCKICGVMIIGGNNPLLGHYTENHLKN